MDLSGSGAVLEGSRVVLSAYKWLEVVLAVVPGGSSLVLGANM